MRFLYVFIFGSLAGELEAHPGIWKPLTVPKYEIFDPWIFILFNYLPVHIKIRGQKIL